MPRSYDSLILVSDSAYPRGIDEPSSGINVPHFVSHRLNNLYAVNDHSAVRLAPVKAHSAFITFISRVRARLIKRDCSRG